MRQISHSGKYCSTSAAKIEDSSGGDFRGRDASQHLSFSILKCAPRCYSLPKETQAVGMRLLKEEWYLSWRKDERESKRYLRPRAGARRH